MNFTAAQLQNFDAYVRVQRTNKYNMFDSRAREMTNMSKDEWLFCMEHYDALEQASRLQREKAA